VGRRAEAAAGRACARRAATSTAAAVSEGGNCSTARSDSASVASAKAQPATRRTASPLLRSQPRRWQNTWRGGRGGWSYERPCLRPRARRPRSTGAACSRARHAAYRRAPSCHSEQVPVQPSVLQRRRPRRQDAAQHGASAARQSARTCTEIANRFARKPSQESGLLQRAPAHAQECALQTGTHSPVGSQAARPRSLQNDVVWGEGSRAAKGGTFRQCTADMHSVSWRSTPVMLASMRSTELPAPARTATRQRQPRRTALRRCRPHPKGRA